MSNNRDFLSQDYVLTSFITHFDLNPHLGQSANSFLQQTHTHPCCVHQMQGIYTTDGQDTAYINVKVEWPHALPKRWRVRLQKALRNWSTEALSELVGQPCYVKSVQLLSDERCAEMEIIPAKAVETLKRIKKAKLMFKDSNQKATVHFLDCEAKSVNQPQSSLSTSDVKSAQSEMNSSSTFTNSSGAYVNTLENPFERGQAVNLDEGLCTSEDGAASQPYPAAVDVSNRMMPGQDKTKGKTKKVAGGSDAVEEDQCAICLENLINKEILKCNHKFCRECLSKSVNLLGMICPLCKRKFWQVEGNQPKGTMSTNISKKSLPGYDDCGTIEIIYFLPAGIQTTEHPNPGKPFIGTRKTAFLPDNEEGQHVLKLLKQAFNQKLVFIVGTSAAFPRQDVVVWNNISHKTSKDGGPMCNGYPDPDYLKTVQEELKTFAIQ